ncbi:MAG: 3-keto-5-aminohexanoate cleavage protein [Myxococcota bacterium]|nr:3-keto-5-aminohexanoate cleavage protein [Myxococcota bacterium]
MILTAAVVGAELTRERTRHLPFTAEEVADEAARCHEAGAAIVHLHVRDDLGRNTQSAERFAEVIEAIQRKCDCIIQPSTGGAVGMSVEERAGPLACRPEMATLNCGSINFGDDVFVNSRQDIRRLAAAIRGAEAVPELECYEVGHIQEALSLAAEGVIEQPLHFQFVLGVTGAIPAREDVLQFMRSFVPPDATWTVAAVGRSQQPMTELAMRLGGHARVGLEDNIYLSRGVLSEGSAPLVARAATYARSLGREPAEPSRARAMLRLSDRCSRGA